jgi:hypothetical protein
MEMSFDEIYQVAPYSINQRPPHLSDQLSMFLGHSFDELHTFKPARVDAIIATPATSWMAAGRSVILHTFARFRKYFTIVEDLSPALARVYLETGVLPVVAPIRTHFRRRTFAIDPRLVRNIRNQGLKLYVGSSDG